MSNRKKQLFSEYVEQKLIAWVAGQDLSTIPSISLIDDSIWTAHETFVSFPCTLSQSQRKIVHNISSALGLHHVSLGENNVDRFISISKTGDFTELYSAHGGPPDEAELSSYSCFYDDTVIKPNVVGAFFSTMTKEEIESKRNQLECIISEFQGVPIGFKLMVPDSDESSGMTSPNIFNRIASRSNQSRARLSGLTLEDLQPMTHIMFIDSIELLRVWVVPKLSACTEFAFDCEMHSYRSYRGLTCLIQIFVNGSCFLIDTISLWDHIGPMLGAYFENPSIIKVGHAMLSMDIPCLFRDFGITIINGYDTQIAASTLGARHPPSLAALLCQFINTVDTREAIEGTKTGMKRTDWRVRPLTNDMQHYARLDVLFLLDVFNIQLGLMIAQTDLPLDTPQQEELTAIPFHSDLDREERNGMISLVALNENAVVIAAQGLETSTVRSELGNGYFDSDSDDENPVLSLNDELDFILDNENNTEEDEDLWSGWGNSDVEVTEDSVSTDHFAQSSLSKGMETVPTPSEAQSSFSASDFQSQMSSAYISRDQLLTDSRLVQLLLVVALSAEVCARIGVDNLEAMDDLLAYSKSQVFKDRIRNKKRPMTEMEIFVFRDLFQWRTLEAKLRDESEDYICNQQLLMAAAIRLPANQNDLAILCSPLPHSMRPPSSSSIDPSTTTPTRQRNPVDLIGAVAKALSRNDQMAAAQVDTVT